VTFHNISHLIFVTDMVCSLGGRNQVFKYYVAEFCVLKSYGAGVPKYLI